MRIGLLLRLWRRQNRLTQKVAAARIGLTGGTLARLEKGEAMHGATLATVLVWLMGREEPSANETFTFEAENAVAVEVRAECDVEQWAGEFERIAVECGGTKTEAVDGEAAEAPGAAIENEPETAAELPVYGLDKEPAVCGVRPVGV